MLVLFFQIAILLMDVKYLDVFLMLYSFKSFIITPLYCVHLYGTKSFLSLINKFSHLTLLKKLHSVMENFWNNSDLYWAVEFTKSLLLLII